MRSLCLLLLSLSVDAHAQDCSYDVDEYDRFTKKHEVSTSAHLPFGSLRAKVEFLRKDSLHSMVLSYNPGSVVGIAEGAELLFRFANDSVLTLTSMDHEVSDISYSGQYIIHWIRPRMRITAQDLRLFATQRLVAIRIHYTDGYRDEEFPDRAKKQEKIMRAAQCLLQAPMH